MSKPPIQTAVLSNREAWNASAIHHKATEGWKALVASAHRRDFSCLDPTITALLLSIGLAGKSFIQLGCNHGRECLSVAGLSAETVVGVDQSAEILAQARELASISPHQPQFVEADIYALPAALDAAFDLALITIGVLNWMPDLPLRPAESYFRTEPFMDDRMIVYEGDAPRGAFTNYWFVHRLSDIFSGVLEAGLQIVHFQEYKHRNREDTFAVYENQKAQLPMCYTLAAAKR